MKIDFKNPNQKLKNVGGKSKMRQLSYCILINEYDSVNKLLDNPSIEIDYREEDNSTPLIIALQKDIFSELGTERIQIVEKIFEKTKNISNNFFNASTNKKRITALALAINNGEVNIVKKLIHLKVDINQKCMPEYITPIYYALSLISQKADKNLNARLELKGKEFINNPSLMMQDDYIRSVDTNFFELPIDKESIESNVELLKRLSNTKSYFENKKQITEYIQKALPEVTISCKIINELLSQPNIELEIPNINNFTALTFACEINYLPAIKALLENGAKPNPTDVNGNIMPLHFAVSHNNIEVVKLLLKYGADPNIKNDRGESPLMMALNYNKYNKIMEEFAKIN